MSIKAKIMVVDDDPDIREAIKVVLESLDYNVVSARNGREALLKLAEVKPDLMILDLLMPEMDGFAVYKELQQPEWKQYADMAILILTSLREEVSRRRYELETGKDLTVNDYVEKPLDPMELLKRVEKILKAKAKL